MLFRSLTGDENCNWKGEMNTADITCTMTMRGDYWGSEGVETATLQRAQVESESLIVPMTVVTPVGYSAAVPTGSDNASGGAPQSTSQSSALAPAGPLPTVAIGFVGGMAAVFVAAVAL